MWVLEEYYGMWMRGMIALVVELLIFSFLICVVEFSAWLHKKIKQRREKKRKRIEDN